MDRRNYIKAREAYLVYQAEFDKNVGKYYETAENPTWEEALRLYGENQYPDQWDHVQRPDRVVCTSRCCKEFVRIRYVDFCIIRERRTIIVHTAITPCYQR